MYYYIYLGALYLKFSLFCYEHYYLNWGYYQTHKIFSPQISCFALSLVLFNLLSFASFCASDFFLHIKRNENKKSFERSYLDLTTRMLSQILSRIQICDSSCHSAIDMLCVHLYIQKHSFRFYSNRN